MLYSGIYQILEAENPLWPAHPYLIYLIRSEVYCPHHVRPSRGSMGLTGPLGSNLWTVECIGQDECMTWSETGVVV